MPRKNPAALKPVAGRIKIVENGPYLVTGGVPLSEWHICVNAEGQCHGWKEGRKYPAAESYALCRCGRSADKPFCDGTHMSVGFDGTEKAGHAAYLDRAEEIEGPDLLLTDVPTLCAGARFCHRGGGTWDLTERSDDPEARRLAVEEACECPAGRLAVWDRDGRAIEPEFEPSIGLVFDTQAGMLGPIWVRGGIPIESADGRVYEARNRVTLCRCGKSQNKPFCDGRHLR